MSRAAAGTPVGVVLRRCRRSCRPGNAPRSSTSPTRASSWPIRVVPGPLTHNGPFLAMVGGLLFGNHVVVMARFEPAETLRLVEEHRVDWMYAVPTMMHRIWRLPDDVRTSADLSSLRIVSTSVRRARGR